MSSSCPEKTVEEINKEITFYSGRIVYESKMYESLTSDGFTNMIPFPYGSRKQYAYYRHLIMYYIIRGEKSDIDAYSLMARLMQAYDYVKQDTVDSPLELKMYQDDYYEIQRDYCSIRRY